MTQGLRPTGKKFGSRVFEVSSGYDLVASSYDGWYWQAFWAANEVPLVTQQLNVMAPGGRALDAGTGTGQYLKILAARGIRSVGLDVSLEMLRQARHHIPGSMTVCGSVLNCPFNNDTFDTVLACRVLSHVPDLGIAFSELGRVTKPTGRAIFSDVSASHNYEATRIPTSQGDVHIETYKHSKEQIASMAVQSGFWTVDFLRDVYFRDLTAPPDTGEFPSIDESSNLPIFVYGVLSRIGS